MSEPSEESATDDAAASWRSVSPAGLMYGVLAVATVIAAESTRQETMSRLLEASLVTIAMYWVAHAYAHHWGNRLDDADDWSLREIYRALAHEASLLLGAAAPTVVLVVAWISGASKETAVSAVLWFAVVELVLLEVIPGLRHHLGVRDMAVQTAIGLAMGLGVLGLRVVLH